MDKANYFFLRGVEEGNVSIEAFEEAVDTGAIKPEEVIYFLK